jgi:hypothetical protein
VSDDAGYPVLALPTPTAKTLATLLGIFSTKLRGLAAGGTDKLILEFAQHSDVTSEQVALLVRLLSEAERLGIETAICAPDEQIVRKLRQIAETRDTRCAATREAARRCLQ